MEFKNIIWAIVIGAIWGLIVDSISIGILVAMIFTFSFYLAEAIDELIKRVNKLEKKRKK